MTSGLTCAHKGVTCINPIDALRALREEKDRQQAAA